MISIDIETVASEHHAKKASPKRESVQGHESQVMCSCFEV